MIRQFAKLSFALACATLFIASSASAGVKIEDEKSGIKVDLGGRLQTHVLFNDSQFNDDVQFKVRRARFRMGITPHKMFTMFLQTDVRNEAGAGTGDDVRMIDAYTTFKPHTWAQLVTGLRMSPASRQILSSSGAMLAFDRPGITNYALTWGMKGNAALQNRTVAGTQGGAFADDGVRDLGATLFGSGSFSESFHGKYYLSIAEGSVESDDTERYTARFQLNFGDAEPKYYNSATYLGKLKTIGFGASYDYQKDIAANSINGQGVDYQLYSIDLFAEQPIGPGSLTAEAAYTDLDLDDAPGSFTAFGSTDTLGFPAMQVQGNGFYVQVAYYINKFQPFFLYEQWDADGANNAGDWQGYRGGLAYFVAGHNCAIKLAYEHIANDTVGRDDIDTIGTGIFINF